MISIFAKDLNLPPGRQEPLLSISTPVTEHRLKPQCKGEQKLQKLKTKV